MRRALGSLLLSRSNGSSTSWRIGNPIFKVCPSTEQGNVTRDSNHCSSPEERAEQGPCVSNPRTNFSRMNGRGSYATYLHSHTLRSYATMSGSTNPAAAYDGEDSKKKSQATLMYLVALVLAMVGCSYAAVPLYRKFCQATGYGGAVRRRETVEEKIARHAQEGVAATRPLVVQFNADIADGLPWKFTPTQREVRVKPGQSTLAFFTAENLSSKPITGVSTYNVTPMKAAPYFNKIQCFCFEEQRLLPGEKIDMPVFFYIDPEFATDPKMDNINNLILSYTFFKVEEDEESSVKD
ncbi:hypothetical protein GOP47_0015843 [Adiantum capillus-veneris]|uniref:Uncharacterized protein n=1 Tax=Adiantum capillus-veneris TaxID=13818 RepID=A0A9D4UKR6_ADICA|nr:hypothetical protein GOP47_0015843 [Adiantum capillus-veneris]